MSEVKSMNNFSKFAGVLSEASFTKEKGFVEGNEGNKIPCEVIKGKISIENENGTFPINVYSSSKTKQGKDNTMYNGIDTFMKNCVSKIDATKNANLTPDFVICNTQVNMSSYVNNQGELSSNLQIRLNGAKRVQNGAGNSSINMDGVITKIVPETVNEHETGRLQVEVMNVGYNGVAQFFTAIVKEEDADTFMDNYQVNDTAPLFFELHSTSQKKKNQTKIAFGKRGDTENDFNKLELICTGGGYPYDEDDTDEEGVPSKLSRSVITELRNEYEIYVENLKKNQKNDKKNTFNSSTQGLKNTPKEVDDGTDLSELF